jgi:uncharacterized protein (UPF0332 family)
VSPEEEDLWTRADAALETASRLVEDDADAATSRAYYSAFYAVQAVFVSRGLVHTRHKAVEVAVHRDLVKTCLWDAQLGADFSWLVSLRYTADYGGQAHVAVEHAHRAVECARRIVQAARTLGRAPSSR